MTFEHQGTCLDARSPVEHDPLHVAEILCLLGVAQMDRDPELDAVFVVEQLEEAGSQHGAKIMHVDFQICVMFVIDE